MCRLSNLLAYLTFRIIEAQLKLNLKQSPIITIEDVEKSNYGVEIIREMDVIDLSLAKIDQIKKDNSEFGYYVVNI